DEICLCALEKGFKENKISFKKPISCHLYPVRITVYPSFTAVNYDKRNICNGAEIYGRSKGIRVYEFLKEPLIRRFGEEWYKELAFVASEYLMQKSNKSI
ncbi:MAG: DUF3109 family protein, partial [Bacteroidales bacterium]